MEYSNLMNEKCTLNFSSMSPNTVNQCLPLRRDKDTPPCYWKDVWQRLYTMRYNWQLCDICLYSDDGMKFKAHSIVLAASSAVFHAELVDQSQTFIYKINAIEHRLPGVTSDVLQVTIDFIYGVVPETILNFKRLQKGAEKLGIAAAISFCRQQLNELELLAKGNTETPPSGGNVQTDLDHASRLKAEVHNRIETSSPSRAQDLLLQCPYLSNLSKSNDANGIVPLKKRFLLKVLSQLKEEESPGNSTTMENTYSITVENKEVQESSYNMTTVMRDTCDNESNKIDQSCGAPLLGITDPLQEKEANYPNGNFSFSNPQSQNSDANDRSYFLPSFGSMVESGSTDNNNIKSSNSTSPLYNYQGLSSTSNHIVQPGFGEMVDIPHPIPDLAFGDMGIQCPHLQKIVGKVDSYTGIPMDVMDDSMNMDEEIDNESDGPNSTQNENGNSPDLQPDSTTRQGQQTSITVNTNQADINNSATLVSAPKTSVNDYTCLGNIELQSGNQNTDQNQVTGKSVSGNFVCDQSNLPHIINNNISAVSVCPVMPSGISSCVTTCSVNASSDISTANSLKVLQRSRTVSDTISSTVNLINAVSSPATIVPLNSDGVNMFADITPSFQSLTPVSVAELKNSLFSSTDSCLNEPGKASTLALNGAPTGTNRSDMKPITSQMDMSEVSKASTSSCSDNDDSRDASDLNASAIDNGANIHSLILLDNQTLLESLKEKALTNKDGKMVYQCIVSGCDYRNKGMEYVQSHLYHRHGLGNPEITCDQCERRYFSEIQLKTHIKQTHDVGAKQKLYKCDDCGEMYKTIQALQMHQLKLHGKGKLFSCEDCTFKSPRKKDLQGHMLSQHNKSPPGVRVFECKHCFYKCIDKNRFNEHEASHTQERNFKCDFCGNFYATRRGLRNHLKYHSNERPHVCNICNATFKVRAKLRDHIRLLHDQKGVKPYQCGHCEFRASVRGNVNQHIRNIHKGMPIEVIDLKKSQRKHVKDYDYANMRGNDIKEVKDASAVKYAAVVSLKTA